MGIKTRDLGTSSGGRGDMWDGDAVREIQGHGGRKDINDYKQLLDEVFVIPGIIKVEVSVIGFG